MSSTLELVIFFAAPVLAMFGLMVVKFMDDFAEIKDNWATYRCNPLYMPFAGLVQPEVGVSMNFNQCMGLMSKNILRVPMDSIQSYVTAFKNTLSAVAEKLNIFRNLRVKLAAVLMSLANMVMGKLSGMVSGLTHTIIKIKDIMGRMAGTGYIGMLFSYTMFLSIKGFWKLAVSILRAFILATMAVGLAVIIFTFIPFTLATTLMAFFAAAGGFSSF
jgi:hypothetical protein